MKVIKAYLGKKRRTTHRFLFNIGGKIVPISTRVRPGTGRFRMDLTEDHVQRAIDANGYGDAQNCAGAVCIKAHADMIPHKFTGYVDFWDTRAFISCRNNTNTNLPSDCVGWKHNHPEIAKLFDTRAGLQKLLKMVRENGHITLEFEAPTYTTGSNTSRKRGQSDPLKRKYRMGHNARVIRTREGGLLESKR